MNIEQVVAEEVEAEAAEFTLNGDAAPLLMQDDVEGGAIQPDTNFFVDFYDAINPGVVSIQIFASAPGAGGLAPAGPVLALSSTKMVTSLPTTMSSPTPVA